MLTVMLVALALWAGFLVGNVKGFREAKQFTDYWYEMAVEYRELWFKSIDPDDPDGGEAVIAAMFDEKPAEQVMGKAAGK
jgi:hypothetical protein